jgi:hypothetical protein
MDTHTNREIAENWNLWREYADTTGEMTEEEWEAMDVDERERMVVVCFGSDDE